jgi:hypothetical protein
MIERRRLGRIENVNPNLIPLWRGEEQPDDAFEETEYGDLAPPTGIIVGVLFSSLLWAILWFVVRIVLRR